MGAILSLVGLNVTAQIDCQVSIVLCVHVYLGFHHPRFQDLVFFRRREPYYLLILEGKHLTSVHYLSLVFFLFVFGRCFATDSSSHVCHHPHFLSATLFQIRYLLRPPALVSGTKIRSLCRLQSVHGGSMSDSSSKASPFSFLHYIWHGIIKCSSGNRCRAGE